MYCVTVMTPTPEKLASALRKSRVTFQIVRARGEKAPRGAQSPGVAQKIYDLVAAGETVYAAIADQCQVSYDTVLRVAHNPAKYGISGPPISRQK